MNYTPFHNWMIEQGLTDAAVAEAIGRSRSLVTRIKLGMVQPSLSTGAKILDLAGGALSPTDLLKSEVNPPSSQDETENNVTN